MVVDAGDEEGGSVEHESRSGAFDEPIGPRGWRDMERGRRRCAAGVGKSRSEHGCDEEEGA